MIKAEDSPSARRPGTSSWAGSTLRVRERRSRHAEIVSRAACRQGVRPAENIPYSCDAQRIMQAVCFQL